MKLSKTLYAYRSRKNGQFFKFIEYSNDDWGKYEAIDSFEYNTPELHDKDLMSPNRVHYEFKNHEYDEIETISFNLEQI